MANRRKVFELREHRVHYRKVSHPDAPAGGTAMVALRGLLTHEPDRTVVLNMTPDEADALAARLREVAALVRMYTPEQ